MRRRGPISTLKESQSDSVNGSNSAIPIFLAQYATPPCAQPYIENRNALSVRLDNPQKKAQLRITTQ